MSASKVAVETTKAAPDTTSPKNRPVDKPQWETPKLEDVSEQVMAQPYIRFT